MTGLDLDRARASRMAYQGDQYPNCRHRGKPMQNGTFYCAEKRRELASCNECRTCVRCNGRLELRGQHVSYARMGAYITEEFRCVNCGAYYTRTRFMTKRWEVTKKVGICQVEGCERRTFEGRQHQDEGAIFLICESHFRKHKTWKYSSKSQEQKPLLVMDGQLIENPEYRKKQERKNG